MMSSWRGLKRKADDALSSSSPSTLSYDAPVLRVAQALANLTRTGATFASGTSERFPLPGLTFHDERVELCRSLGESDVQRIKARATYVSSSLDAPAVWEVDSASLTVRNPRWDVFLDECMTKMREPLGIAPTAVVELVSWSKPTGIFRLNVVATDTRGETYEYETKEDDTGDAQPATKEATTTTTTATITWQPGARENPYDLTYTALYDHCDFITEPIVSGSALCLVYDLVTTTPTEVPLFAGPTVVQQSVEASLARFFDVAPEPLVKRYKISPDAWKIINEFVTERHFAYIIGGYSYKRLEGDDLKIAESLAAFCAQSKGQYVLYTASALCSRYTEDHFKYRRNAEDANTLNVTLRSPWIKYADRPDSTSFPPVYLRRARDVAPFVPVETESNRFRRPQSYMDSSENEIIQTLYRDSSEVEVHPTRALVIQPALIEWEQTAKLPVSDVTRSLRKLLSTSRDEALEYAQRVVRGRPLWYVHNDDTDAFPAFLKVIVEINDVQLFKNVLAIIDLRTVDYAPSLRDAIRHFGWTACADAVLKRMRSIGTPRSRVNWLLSLVDEEAHGTEQGDHLFEVLLSLDPWTDASVDKRHNYDYYRYIPKAPEAKSLFLLAARSSQARLNALTSVSSLLDMVFLVMTPLRELVTANPTMPALLQALLHAWGRFKPMVDKERQEAFNKIRIRPHCVKCGELQSFMASPATETTLRFKGAAQREHIEEVLDREKTSSASIKMSCISPAVLRLVKKLNCETNSVLEHAVKEEALVLEIVSAHVR